MKNLEKNELLGINGGITIEEYAKVCKYLAETNPDQLAAVQAMFDSGSIQFEV
jgi:hypothetical protein